MSFCSRRCCSTSPCRQAQAHAPSPAHAESAFQCRVAKPPFHLLACVRLLALSSIVLFVFNSKIYLISIIELFSPIITSSLQSFDFCLSFPFAFPSLLTFSIGCASPNIVLQHLSPRVGPTGPVDYVSLLVIVHCISISSSRVWFVLPKQTHTHTTKCMIASVHSLLFVSTFFCSIHFYRGFSLHHRGHVFCFVYLFRYAVYIYIHTCVYIFNF